MPISALSLSLSGPLVTNNNANTTNKTTKNNSGGSPGGRPTHLLVTTHECSYDYSLFAASPPFSSAASSSASAAPSPPGWDGNSRLPFESDGVDTDSSSLSSSVFSDSPLSVFPDSVDGPNQAQPSAPASRRWSSGGAAAWGGVVTGGGCGQRGGVEVGGGATGGALVAYEIPETW